MLERHSVALLPQLGSKKNPPPILPPCERRGDEVLALRRDRGDGTSKTTTFTTLILRWAGPEAFAAGFAHAPERRGREPDGGPSHPGQTLGQLKRERHRSTSEATSVPGD